jgi:hypothetical protein
MTDLALAARASVLTQRAGLGNFVIVNTSSNR